MPILIDKLKLPYTFPNPNNVQVKTIGPLLESAAEAPSGNKTFSSSQKGKKPSVN